MSSKVNHISYSAIKTWNECAFKYKLSYEDRIKLFHGNAHTAFGKAMHEVCEKTALEEWSLEEAEENFKKAFILEVSTLPETTKEGSNKKLLKEMFQQGVDLAPLAFPALKKEFGKFDFYKFDCLFSFEP